jgi:hypothetical protein
MLGGPSREPVFGNDPEPCASRHLLYSGLCNSNEISSMERQPANKIKLVAQEA